MPAIPNEVSTKLTNLQHQVWQTVTLTVSEAAGCDVMFGDGEAGTVSTNDVYADAGTPRLVIQFSFADMPENSMMLLMSPETVSGLTGAIRGTPAPPADENMVAELRPLLEAIVQGTCLAIGNSKNEPTVASGLSIRFHIPSFPPNLQKTDEMVRVTANVTCDAFSGPVTWLMDAEVAHHITGVEILNEEQLAFKTVAGGAFGGGSQGSIYEDSSLEIIMDIPLEVSVELGRVKMQVKEVVELGAGSIVEIDKAAGEPVDVLVNGRMVARGEVVVIDDNFGVRITEILSLQERLQKLNEAA